MRGREGTKGGDKEGREGARGVEQREGVSEGCRTEAGRDEGGGKERVWEGGGEGGREGEEGGRE